MAKTQQNSQPCRARVHTVRHEVVIIDIFGKLVALDVGTPERAGEVCNEWNEHLSREWMTVRETNATLLNVFCEKLKEEGVSEQTLRNAMGALKTDG